MTVQKTRYEYQDAPSPLSLMRRITKMSGLMMVIFVKLLTTLFNVQQIGKRLT